MKANYLGVLCIILATSFACFPDEDGGTTVESSGATDSVDLGTGQADTVCSQSCDGKECGDDGCGGNCGVCGEAQQCEEGLCVEKWVCGDGTCSQDGGEDCETCAEDCPCGCGEECMDGGCAFTACEGAECGDDGCGGFCGTCGSGQECVEGKCECVPDVEVCDDLDNDCDGETDNGDADEDGYDVCSDCDDQNPDAYPDNTEVAGDGVDQDCDGHDLGNCPAGHYSKPVEMFFYLVSNGCSNQDCAQWEGVYQNDWFLIPSWAVCDGDAVSFEQTIEGEPGVFKTATLDFDLNWNGGDVSGYVKGSVQTYSCGYCADAGGSIY